MENQPSPKVIEQILAVRATGQTNMFAARDVQRIAYEIGLHELVCYIEDCPKEYANFILTGKCQ